MEQLLTMAAMSLRRPDGKGGPTHYRDGGEQEFLDTRILTVQFADLCNIPLESIQFSADARVIANIVIGGEDEVGSEFDGDVLEALVFAAE